MKITGLEALIKEQEGLERLKRADIETLQLEKLNRLLRLEKERQGFSAPPPSKSFAVIRPPVCSSIRRSMRGMVMGLPLRSRAQRPK